MTSTTFAHSSAFAATSAITAAIAALALTACGPHDASEPSALVGGASTTQTAATALPQTPPPGTPVPLVTPQSPATVGAAPAISVVPTPAPPLRVAQAQTPYPAQPGNARYEPRPNYSPAPEQRRVVESRPVDRASIGSVESIEPIRERPQGTGAGAVLGGVLGAVVGNQFGHGSGRAAMTGLGAVGGAVAGNNVERNRREGITGYRVSVRLDNGSRRTFEREQIGGLQVGDRVRLDANSFHRV